MSIKSNEGIVHYGSVKKRRPRFKQYEIRMPRTYKNEQKYKYTEIKETNKQVAEVDKINKTEF